MNYIGHASFDAVASWEKQHMARGGQVFLDWAEVELEFKGSSQHIFDLWLIRVSGGRIECEAAASKEYGDSKVAEASEAERAFL